jgi:hypothetical protein
VGHYLEGFHERIGLVHRSDGDVAQGRPRTSVANRARPPRLAYRRPFAPASATARVWEPGIGKTRLVEEAVGRLGEDPLVVRGRCLPYGEGITFFPVGEAVASAVGIEREDDAARAKAKIASMLPADASRVADRVSEAIGLGGRPGARRDAWRSGGFRVAGGYPAARDDLR